MKIRTHLSWLVIVLALLAPTAHGAENAAARQTMKLLQAQQYCKKKQLIQARMRARAESTKD